MLHEAGFHEIDGELHERTASVIVGHSGRAELPLPSDSQ
jgi:hypothetical protein